MKRVAIGIVLAATVVVLAWSLQEAVSYNAAETGTGQETTNAASACDHDADAFCSELPLIELDTGGQTIGKEDVIVGRIEVIDHGEGSRAHPDDVPVLEEDVALKYRGASSYLTFDKMSYRITFLEDGADGAESRKKDVSLLGMAQDSEWVLYGPFLDRSLMRNRLMYGLSREIMDWAPDTRFFELFVDGEYQGLYLAVEPVRNSALRLGLTEFGLLSGQTSYVLKRDREGTEPVPLETYGNENGFTQQEMSIAYPSANNITEAQKDWIKSDFDAFERALYSDEFADPEVGYAAYIDVDSFVDYYLLNEFAMITDAGILSTYTYKNLNGKLHMAVWDFNNGFDSYAWFPRPTDEFIVDSNNWFSRLLQDRAFVDAVVARWHELREGSFSDEALLARLDADYAALGGAIDRNFELWGYTFTESLLSPNEDLTRRDPDSFEAAVDQLETTMLTRAAWLDGHIADLYANCTN